jgi:BMFP domain-containing protein YqiC
MTRHTAAYGTPRQPFSRVPPPLPDFGARAVAAGIRNCIIVLWRRPGVRMLVRAVLGARLMTKEPMRPVLDSVKDSAAAPGTHDPSVCTLAIIEWRQRASAALQVASRAITEGDQLRRRVAELEADPGLSDAEAAERMYFWSFTIRARLVYLERRVVELEAELAAAYDDDDPDPDESAPLPHFGQRE